MRDDISMEEGITIEEYLTMEEYMEMEEHILIVKEIPSKLLEEIHWQIVKKQRNILEELEKEMQIKASYHLHNSSIQSIYAINELGNIVDELIQESAKKIEELERDFDEREQKYGVIRRIIYREMYNRNYRSNKLKILENRLNTPVSKECSGYDIELCKKGIQMLYENMSRVEREEWEEYKKTE